MDIPLAEIKGIGPARLNTLRTVGITTVRQLLLRLPVSYRDTKSISAIAQIEIGSNVTVEVTVKSISQNRYNGLCSTKARVFDESGTILVVWYNQPWLINQIHIGDKLTLYGRAEMKKTIKQLICPSFVTERGLIPVYKPLKGIPSKTYSRIVLEALSACEGQWPDELPEEMRRRYELCERNFAMRAAHLPESQLALEQASRRLAFEELLLYQIALWILRSGASKGAKIDYADCGEYWSKLSYEPTLAQRRVVDEISRDLKSDYAMSRLVQGDVGCGKTAVAFAGIFLSFKSGFQSAMMAPTEVLARQHFEAAKRILEPLGARVGLLTGSLTAKEKALAHDKISSGEWSVVIGTHALISQGVEYSNLGLVITDEQHRFGVRQRAALTNKGNHANVLVMSATPIPRTLALILYGDLDISIIDELPPGRSPVKTRVVPEEKRSAMYGFIKNEIKNGRQAYIICPLVEENEDIEAASAEKVYEELKNGPLSDVRMGLSHGKLKTNELKEVLSDFKDGKIDVLVSTTVVEVGVDVPNASVMVIEGADRFGLTQLHQLRGRVGRGKAESWCFLMAKSNDRLELLTKTNDGFEISKKDMEYRGAGELFGFRQSGMSTGGITSVASDAQLLKQTHDEARRLMKNADSDESKAVLELARAVYAERLVSISMN